jgi:hypothetical protein
VIVRALVLAAALALATAVPAAARPLLDDEDAEELVQTLRDAAAAQDICYGWEVRVNDQGGASSGTDQGSSSGGAGIPLPSGECDRYAVFTADITYTSTFSESEDSVTAYVESNVLPPEVDRLGISPRDLLGDEDDEALIRAVTALPSVAAQTGVAPWVEPEPLAATAELDDAVTTSGGSDWLRERWPALALSTVVALAGLVWLGLELAGRRVAGVNTRTRRAGSWR